MRVPPAEVLDVDARGSAMARRAASAGLAVGPLVAVAMVLAGPPQGLAEPGWWALALLALMVIWWITEALPLAATALLPIVMLPLLGISSPAAAAAPYADPIIFLFIGGFVLALAIERSGVHERLALGLAAALGGRPLAVLASFALAGAFASMWISNTATALMLIPTAQAVAVALADDSATRARLGLSLTLMVAYAASIGGIGTPVGSPTNLVAMGYLERQGLDVSFVAWMSIAVPIVIAMLAAAWLLLALPLRRLDVSGIAGAAVIAERRARLGPWRAEEVRVLVVFGLVALAWITRPWINEWPPLARLSDTGIALLGALLLFVLPSGDTRHPGRKLMDWPTAERLPWGIALLFGGGLSIAAALTDAGVTDWLGQWLASGGALPGLLVLVLVVSVTIFATELMSNTATLTAMLPVVGALALATGLAPLELAIAAAVAASMAFMLPIATPPNAIAFATGHIPILRMARIGIWLNLIGIVVITAAVHWLAPRLLGAG
jgi:sodium-dependent dicarboxylate transporter 2/3/5